MDATQRTALLADRLYYEACFDNGTSDDYIDGYFSDTVDDGDSPSRSDEIQYAQNLRNSAYWGVPCYPLSSYRYPAATLTDAQQSDLDIVIQQGNDWMEWIFARTHLRKGESIDHNASSVFVAKLDWECVPEFALLVFRKTNQSGIWYVIPSLRFDWNYITLSFQQDPTGKDATDPNSYLTHPSFSNLQQAENKKEHRGIWSKIVSASLAIGETACFGKKLNGAYWGAGVQAVKGIYDSETEPRASALNQAVSDLESFISDADEKLIINRVTSIIKLRNDNIAKFMNDLDRILTQYDITTEPSTSETPPYMETLQTWLATFQEYTDSECVDQLPEELIDLTVNKYGGNGFPVFVAGVNVHNLCWQYYHALAGCCKVDSETRQSRVTAYLTEMAEQWIKLMVRFSYESVDDRIRAQVKLQDSERTIQDSYLDVNVSINKKKKPFTDVSRYFNNIYGQWVTDNAGGPGQISSLELAAHLAGRMMAWPPDGAQLADSRTIIYNNVAQSTPYKNDTTNWRNGRYLQYGVRFVYEDGLNYGKTNQTDIIWSSQGQVEGWVFPRLIHIPVCHFYSASSRQFVRRWGDMTDGALVWQPEEILTTFDDREYPRQIAIWDEKE